VYPGSTGNAVEKSWPAKPKGAPHFPGLASSNIAKLLARIEAGVEAMPTIPRGGSGNSWT